MQQVLQRRATASEAVPAGRRRASPTAGVPSSGWMQVAARLLADGQAKVSTVALQVGYDSEAAFSRAFKKAAGVPPAAWRSQYAKPQ
jgi:methylphosphotriester-DNA--protein-cysteine methyltransferase